MLKPSGNMCKGADKAMAHQIVAAKIADELVSETIAESLLLFYRWWKKTPPPLR
jgi:hypothetical protein